MVRTKCFCFYLEEKSIKSLLQAVTGVKWLLLLCSTLFFEKSETPFGIWEACLLMADIYLARVRDGGRRKLIENKRHANLTERNGLCTQQGDCNRMTETGMCLYHFYHL